MQKTGQKSAMRRLIFNIDCVTKERELVKAGINSFVYESDITNYIENVASKVVKIVELENFSREVPDEIVDIIDRVGHLFDQMYVVFTDYTGEEERKVTAARREKTRFFSVLSRTNAAVFVLSASIISGIVVLKRNIISRFRPCSTIRNWKLRIICIISAVFTRKVYRKKEFTYMQTPFFLLY